MLPCAIALASPAFAQEGAEQLEQLEPGAGEWQAEYFGAFGGEGRQSAEALAGISDRLAIGAEVELAGPGSGIAFETLGVAALYRAVDPERHAVGLGIKGQLSFGRDGRLDMESRLIAETRRRGWWIQADLILRRAREDGAQATGIAYAASAQRALGHVWLGLEASGQLVRLEGAPALAPQGRHYAGPSLTFERPLRKGDVEIGVAWLQRIRGDGPGSGPRIFVQLTR